MKKDSLQVAFCLILLVASLFMLFGCGGESGSVTTPPVNIVGGNGMISGTAVKGPIDGGMVTAYAINNGAKSSQLASATTDLQGNFSMTIGDYSGPAMLLLSGGTYTDEATGSMMTMAATDTMSAVIPSISAGVTMTGIQLTPITSMAQTMAGNMSGGMTSINIDAANTAMGNYFKVSDILHTQSMNPLVAGSGAGATQDMRNYGMVMAAMTEYAKTLGMTASSGIVTAMMNDASDGVMSGMMGDGAPIAMGGGMSMMGGGKMMQANTGTSGLAKSMTNFMNSGMNKSGLSIMDMQALINQLNSTSGKIQ